LGLLGNIGNDAKPMASTVTQTVTVTAQPTTVTETAQPATATVTVTQAAPLAPLLEPPAPASEPPYVAMPPQADPVPPLAPLVPQVPSSAYYRNCAAARAAGAAPLHVGDPGYRPGLDGDGDGVACE
jgi:hypothetical protein